MEQDYEHWPRTYRNHFGIGLPLTPESYFAIQGYEQHYAPLLEGWCRSFDLIPPDAQVHGLILSFGPQYGAMLMCEWDHSHGECHHILNILSVEIPTPLRGDGTLAEKLQRYIWALRPASR